MHRMFDSPAQSLIWMQAERAAALAELSSAKAKLSELENELAKYGSCDPIKIEAKRRAESLAHEAAVRWTGESLSGRPTEKY